MTTIDTLVAEHLSPLRKRNRQNHTSTMKQWRGWLDAQPGAPTIVDATGDHVQRWMSEQLDAGTLSPLTVKQRYSHVRSLYDDLLRDGVITTDPCRWVRSPRAPRRSHRTFLGPAQLLALLDASQDAHPAIRAAVHLWGLSGLRPAEPIRARIEHVGRVDDQMVLTVPERKGGDSDRLALASPTVNAIAAAADGRRTGPLLWHPRLDRPLDLVTARGELVKLARAAGIDTHITPYSLRHTFITLSLEAGVPERDTSLYAGHVDSSQIPVYDRLRSTVSVERAATYRLVSWLAEQRREPASARPALRLVDAPSRPRHRMPGVVDDAADPTPRRGRHAA